MNIKIDRVRGGAIGLLVLVWLWAFLTAKDQFWAGRAAFISAFILLGIALYEVMENAMEKH